MPTQPCQYQTASCQDHVPCNTKLPCWTDRVPCEQAVACRRLLLIGACTPSRRLHDASRSAQGAGVDKLEAFLRTQFRTVGRTHVKASRPESPEMYLVCQGHIDQEQRKSKKAAKKPSAESSESEGDTEMDLEEEAVNANL